MILRFSRPLGIVLLILIFFITPNVGHGQTTSPMYHKLIDLGTDSAVALTYCTQSSTGTQQNYNLDVSSPIPIGKLIEATFNGTKRYYKVTYSTSAQSPSAFIIRGSLTDLDVCANAPDPSGGGVFGNENYVFTRSYQKTASNTDGAIEQITYFDGLGRPKQTIEIDQSPTLQDIVTFIGYDSFGRQDKQYLPVPDATGTAGSFKTGDIAAKTQSYYKSNYGTDFLGTAATSNPYAETRFEASPLNRPLEQGAPGDAWEINPTSDADHSVKFEYKANTANEVRLYKVSLTSSYVPSLIMTTYYAAGELYKSVIKDENWTSGVNNTTEEFKDKQGRVVLKRTYNASVAHDTYYVYDAYGNLTYVLPPKSEPQSAKPDATELAELCYQYKYDKRNRLVEKKIPGKNVEFIVYNDLDQPVLTQDANLKAQNKWLYTKYDAFGRVISTGLFTNNSSTQAIMQAALDNHYNGTAKAWEEKTATSTNNYYTNQSYPTSSIEVLTLNYYDNYTFDTAGLKLNAGTLVFDDNVEYTTKGLPTGSRVKVLGQTNWITTVMHYDEKGRVIYSASNNAFLGSTDKVKQDLDFIGNVLATETTHTKGSMNIVTLENYTYDHVNRLLKHTQTLNGRTELIAENAYSETGELKSKKVGNIASSSTRLQTVDFTYNVRGWLKQINNPASLGTDLFGFKLNYNTAGHGATPLYNGNIAETEWKTQNDNMLRWYNYSYDNLNRLTAATANSSNYNVSGIIYDKNGNIKNLTRRGQTNAAATTFGNMDVLTYGYSSYSNKLLNVNDTGNTAYGFKDASTLNTQYRYDPNGNMVMDDNKKIGTPTIDGITYNHLNLPTSVTLPGGTISYIYDATGVKQRKVAAGTTTEYAGNYLYQGGTLQFFNHPEGYVEYDGGSYNYVYNYTDHLGNVRLSYTNTGTTSSPNIQIIEENNYYPFGLEHKGYNNVINGKENDFQTYNGKEYDKTLGLNWHDYGARRYDASLGRWMSTDPFAEKYETLSPYTYVSNNPVNAIDPDGRLIIYVNGLLFSQALGHKTTGFSGGEYVGHYAYPPPRNFFYNQEPTMFGQQVNYWGNTRGTINKHFGGDDKNIFVNATDHFGSQAKDRFAQGQKSGLELIENIKNGTIVLENEETIKIVGHSQGAAFAAGMLTELVKSEYASRVEAGIYLSPHQPGDFAHPDGVFGAQFSTETDAVSSGFGNGLKGDLLNLLFNGGSDLSEIFGSDYTFIRVGHGSSLGGHEVQTWDSLLKQIDESLKKAEDDHED